MRPRVSARALGAALSTPHGSPLDHVLDLATGEVIALLPDCDPEEDVQRFADGARYRPIPHVSAPSSDLTALARAFVARASLEVELVDEPDGVPTAPRVD